MAFDQNAYITNKNNNAASVTKNGDGTYTITYTSLNTVDGTTNYSTQTVSLTDLLNQQTTFQTNLSNLGVVLDDLRSLG